MITSLKKGHKYMVMIPCSGNEREAADKIFDVFKQELEGVELSTYGFSSNITQFQFIEVIE